MKRSITTVALSLIAGVAIAASTPQPNSTGWYYGFQNCGPTSGITTARACKNCCKAAWIANTITHQERLDCAGYCDGAQFQPPRAPFWARALVTIFGPGQTPVRRPAVV